MPTCISRLHSMCLFIDSWMHVFLFQSTFRMSIVQKICETPQLLNQFSGHMIGIAMIYSFILFSIISTTHFLTNAFSILMLAPAVTWCGHCIFSKIDTKLLLQTQWLLQNLYLLLYSPIVLYYAPYQWRRRTKSLFSCFLLRLV